MIAAYEELHENAWAHSIEVWQSNELVGGLYGLCIGKAFFGESMFSATPNASKMALLYLTTQLVSGEIGLLDCQVVSRHLLSLGAQAIPRSKFIEILDSVCDPAKPKENWPNTAIACSQLLQE